MAVKRVFNLKNEKARTCLKCGRVIPVEEIEDDRPFTCPKCGQTHFVDIYGNACSLTVKEKPDLRRRHPDFKTPLEIKLALRLAAAEERAAAAEKDAQEWQQAAEGLARAVEDLTEEKRIREKGRT